MAIAAHIVALLAAMMLALSNAQTPQNQKCRNPVANCNPSINYFPKDKRLTIKYAKETIPQLAYRNTYVDVTISFTVTNFATGSQRRERRRYRFVKCGCKAPAGGGRTLVYIGPKAVYMDDSIGIAMLDTLDSKLTSLKYVKSSTFKYNRDLRRKVRAGVIRKATAKDLAADSGLSVILENQFGISGEAASVASKRTPAVIIAELDEATPLGRAEWLKFFGLLFDKPKAATNIFNRIVKDYNRVAFRAKKAKHRPSVFFNAPSASFSAKPSAPLASRYTWSQPGGQTYVEAFIRDANADYRLAGNGGQGSSSLKLGEIEGKFKSAEYLLNADYFPNAAGRNMRDFVTLGRKGGQQDRELQRFLSGLMAVRCGNVISRSRRVVQTGPGTSASDAFEQAVVRPDLVLADYVSILHPDVDIKPHRPTFMYRYKTVKSLGLRCPFSSLLGKPRRGTVYVDKILTIRGMSRFQVEDALVPKVIPQLWKRGVRVSRTDFQFLKTAGRKSALTRLRVRQEVVSVMKKKTMNSRAVLDAFRAGLPKNKKVRITVQ